jgi:hypothetical protein
MMQIVHAAAVSRRIWHTVLIGAAALIILAGAPSKSIAGDIDCASHSLTREDISLVEAAARPTLPRSARLFISDACWNPRSARAGVLTRKSTAADGVLQWSQALCRREELEWQCDPAEFKQLIKLSLAIDHQSHVVELSIDKETPPDRAKVLVARALDIYADPDSRLPGCEIAAPKDLGLVNVHRESERPPGGEPIHVSLSRDGVVESVFLDDVAVAIEFPANVDTAARPEASCWNEVVVVS